MFTLKLKLIAAGVALALTAFGGYRIGAGLTEARYLKAAESRQNTLQARRSSAAGRMAKTEVRHEVIRERIEPRIVEVPVYGTCEHDDTVFGLLNDAITNRDFTPRDSSLSGADSP